MLLLLMLSCFSHVWLCATPQMATHQGPRPWDSPGKNTGLGCHFLLRRMKVKSESEVARSCPTLPNPMDCSLPASSIHGIFQARVLEWVAIPSPGDLPNPGIDPRSPALQADSFLPTESPEKPQIVWISPQSHPTIRERAATYLDIYIFHSTKLKLLLLKI